MAKGAACDTSAGSCYGTLQCVSGFCADALGPGATCSAFPFGGCNSLGGLQCAANKCTAIGLGAPGQACGVIGGEIKGCAGGDCVNQSSARGTCALKLADGATCNAVTGAKCASGASCVAGSCTVLEPAACK